MKKIISRIFLVLLVLVISYTIFNQFDISEVKTEFKGKTEVEILGKPDYSKENGFYRLLSLDEPEGIDVESDEIYMKYRKIYDPTYDNIKFAMKLKNKKKSDYIKKFKKFRKEHKNSENWFFSHSNKNNIGYCNNILEDKAYVIKLKNLSKTYLDRYQKLIKIKKYEDISRYYLAFPSSEITFEDLSPIPNLLQWLRLGKVYNLVHTLDAIDGNWERGINNLIVHINFLKKGPKTNKILITHLISRALMEFTIISINDLLNHKDCPVEMADLILKMPDLRYEEYGSQKALMAETVVGPTGRMFYNDIFNKKSSNILESLAMLFLHKNRTLKVYDEQVKRLLNFDKTPPYLWKEEFTLHWKSKKGFFWWLQNPVGKQFLDVFISIGWPNLNRVIFNNYGLKAMYDMLQISAELRLKYDVEKPVMETLKNLDSYKRLIDLCSGKPYRWNGKKQLLYSIGVDRKDNDGKNDFTKILGNDYALPVILYVK